MKDLYRIKRLLSSRGRYLLPAALLALLLLFSATLLLPRLARPAPPAPASLPEASPESTAAAVYSPEAEPARWLLAERAGQVAVYCGGKKLFVTDIEPAILRSSDRELLRRGIEADSMEAVLMLIEDLSS